MNRRKNNAINETRINEIINMCITYYKTNKRMANFITVSKRM